MGTSEPPSWGGGATRARPGRRLGRGRLSFSQSAGLSAWWWASYLLVHTRGWGWARGSAVSGPRSGEGPQPQLAIQSDLHMAPSPEQSRIPVGSCPSPANSLPVLPTAHRGVAICHMPGLDKPLLCVMKQVILGTTMWRNPEREMQKYGTT